MTCQFIALFPVWVSVTGVPLNAFLQNARLVGYYYYYYDYDYDDDDYDYDHYDYDYYYYYYYYYY